MHTGCYVKAPWRSDRAQVEELWRSRLKESYSRYMDAAAKYRDAFAANSQGQLPRPDGSFSVTQAHREESAALNEYVRFLRIYTEIATQQKQPPGE